MKTTDETIQSVVGQLGHAQYYDMNKQPQKDALALIILLLDDIRHKVGGTNANINQPESK